MEIVGCRHAKDAGVECSAPLEMFVIVDALPFHTPDSVFRQHWTLIGGNADLYQWNSTAWLVGVEM